MRAPPFFISATDLGGRLGDPDWPTILDLRADDVRAGQDDIPCSLRPPAPDARSAVPAGAGPVVVVCKAGHERSQTLAASLRADGIPAQTLEGGYAAWSQAGLPVLRRSAVDAVGGPDRLWVTRRTPKIDRVACPWLIHRFLDPSARFLFVDPPDVNAVAARLGAVSFDAPGAMFEHEGQTCTFDAILRALGLDAYAPLSRLADIVRGADTGALNLAPEAAGYLAVSLGLSAMHPHDDYATLRHGFVVLDGLFSWARDARGETHSWTRRS